MKVNTDEQLREEAWTKLVGYSNHKKILSCMLKKKENKFLQIPRKTTQADTILLCNSDGADDDNVAFLKETSSVGHLEALE